MDIALVMTVGISMIVSLGIIFGLVFGAASGAASDRKKVPFHKPLPHPLGLFER
jgi:hypothetical protein